MQATPSASWTTQAPYAGDPRNRPQGTVCITFDDDYHWLITGSVRKWEHWVEGDRKIHAAITGTRRYEHVLGSHEVRVIDSVAALAVDDDSTAPQEHKTVEDTSEEP